MFSVGFEKPMFLTIKLKCSQSKMAKQAVNKKKDTEVLKDELKKKKRMS